MLISIRNQVVALLALLLLGCPPPCSAGEVIQVDTKLKNLPLVSVTPPSLKPGDVFAVTVRGAAGPENTSGTFRNEELFFGNCGEDCSVAVGAVALDTPPGKYGVEIRVGTNTVKRQLTVKRASFKTIHLTLPAEKVILSPEDLARVEREAKLLKGLWQSRTDRLWEGSFALPLNGPISSAFGIRRILNKEKVSTHTGIDMRGKPGDPVRASNRGRVVLADDLFYGGTTVILDHGLGVFTVYMHLTEAKISPGDIVSKGRLIGLVGSTGRSSGPHLHFGAKAQELSVSPLSLVRLPL